MSKPHHTENASASRSWLPLVLVLAVLILAAVSMFFFLEETVSEDPLLNSAALPKPVPAPSATQEKQENPPSVRTGKPGGRLVGGVPLHLQWHSRPCESGVPRQKRYRGSSGVSGSVAYLRSRGDGGQRLQSAKRIGPPQCAGKEGTCIAWRGSRRDDQDLPAAVRKKRWRVRSEHLALKGALAASRAEPSTAHGRRDFPSP